MDNHRIPERHPEKVDAGRTDACSESPNMMTLLTGHRVDGIPVLGDRSNFDDHPLATITGNQIDFPVDELHIAGNDRQTLLGQPPGGEALPGRTNTGAAVAQSLSSVFSSFSTFTSRKVRTWTVSRKRAGRNMSQTHASVI